MGKLIQVVEDDPDIRFIVEYILEEASYRVESFADATTFVNRTQQEKVDLFILDVMLPDGNGIELCRALKADALTIDIPVIIMSAHSSGVIALQQGKADEFIHKPFDMGSFVSKVNDTIKICSR
jgi:two-component system phosphate regulon response regulator PhoB